MQSTRVALLTLLLLLPLGGLQCRLIDLQLSNRAAHIGDLFTRHRSLDLAVAPRGQIVDRSGLILAKDEWAFDLHVVMEEFERRPAARADLLGLLGFPAAEYEEAFEKIYLRIEKLMNGRPEKERPRIYARERRTPYPLFRNIPRAAAQVIETGLDRFPGLVVREGHRRVYPNGTAAAHVLGMLGRTSADEEQYKQLLKSGYFTDGFEDLIGEDGITLLDRRGTFRETLMGRAGVEKTYDDRLRGRSGLIILERDPETGRKNWIELKAPEPGATLELTIDLALQQELDRALAGMDHVATVLLADCRTGAILAMGSSATYDPNDFVPPTRNTARYNDPILCPTVNRAVQSRFQLGSIFKIAMSVAALEEGAITPSTIFPCNGRYRENLSKFNCWIWNEHRGMHGEVNLRGALEQSCNCYYFAASERLSLGQISAWSRKLGFGVRTGIDLPGEPNGNVPSPEKKAQWRETDSYSLVIGQHELAVSPVQVLRMMCAVGNGGTLVIPHVANDFKGEELPIGIKKTTLDAVNDGLRACVHGDHGTARSSGLGAIDAGGKTGTAQTYGGKGTHAWFAGVAPLDNPRVAMVVLVEHAGHGGAIAAPIASKLGTKAMELQ